MRKHELQRLFPTQPWGALGDLWLQDVAERMVEEQVKAEAAARQQPQAGNGKPDG